MRLLIARLFWRFDFELQPQSAKWNQQKAYLLWEKPPMFVKLIPRDLPLLVPQQGSLHTDNRPSDSLVLH
jgi:hypothetical protein